MTSGAGLYNQILETSRKINTFAEDTENFKRTHSLARDTGCPNVCSTVKTHMTSGAGLYNQILETSRRINTFAEDTEKFKRTQ